jgi:putative pyruvate formate lyase activating enzyme
MGQYRPEHKVPLERSKYSEITRRPVAEEMAEAYDLADELGLVYSPVS